MDNPENGDGIPIDLGTRGYHPHPLQNQVILRHFFQLCPSDLLAECRLVCKEWHELSLTFWRRKSTPMLCYSKNFADADSSTDESDTEGEEPESGDEEISEDGNSTDEEINFTDEDDESASEDSASDNGSTSSESEDGQEDRGNSIQEFLDFSEDPESHYARAPYRSFFLELWEFQDKSLLPFWTSVGTYITHLSLYNCKFPGADDFRQIIFNTCQNLETLQVIGCSFAVIDPVNLQEGLQYIEPRYGLHRNLRKLYIRTYLYFYAEEEGQPLPISWLELLSHFPEVVQLSIYFPHSLNTSEVCKALQAINTIRSHDRSKLPVVHFDSRTIVLSNESREIFSLLQKLHIPLDYLNIELAPDLDNEMIKRILEPYIRTCDRLWISGIGGPGFPFGVVPVSDNFNYLTMLDLSGDICENLDFLGFTPNLVRLNITDETIGLDGPAYRETQIVRNTSNERMTTVKLSKMEDITIHYLISEDDLRCLVQWFPPTMKYCQLAMNDELFPIVCDHWRNLKVLEVLGDALTEEGIMGRVPSKSDQNLEGDRETESRPNITYLHQALEMLCLRHVRLTEFTVMNGLLKLPRLNYLQLHHTSEIGAEGRKALLANGVYVEFCCEDD